MKKAIIIIGLAALLLTSCDMFGPISEPEPWRVQLGMTMSEVREIMDGAPRTSRYESPPYEIWTYIGSWSGYTFTFKNGIVISKSSTHF